MNTELIQFLNKGFLNKREAGIAMFFPKRIKGKNAKLLFNILRKKTKEFSTNEQFEVTSYTGNNKTTLSIQSYLVQQNHKAIVAALIHGSIADENILPYSDFDGILIIDENLIDTSEDLMKLRSIIQKTEKMMFSQDALQHHGWHILLKEELGNYPDTKLPNIILKRSKSLVPLNGISIKLMLNKSEQDYSHNFKVLSASIRSKLENKSYNQNFYSFKNLISEILLLPAVYLQALDNKPVLKIESFKIIKKEFNTDLCSIINEIEDLRLNWSQKEANFTREQIANQFKYIKPLQNALRQPLPFRYKNWFNSDRTEEMRRLITFMKEQLEIKKTYTLPKEVKQEKNK